MDTQKQGFDFSKRAGAYDEGIEGKVSQRFYNLLLQELKVEPGARLLDVGCGTGTLLKRIAAQTAVECSGVDQEESMLAVAKENFPGGFFFLAPCDDLPFEDTTFDAVVACMAYHHFANKNGFARETARVLKPGGMLYLIDPRFPWLVRKVLNGIIKLHHVSGEFNTSQELASRFAPYGFLDAGAITHGYAQAVKLLKPCSP